MQMRASSGKCNKPASAVFFKRIRPQGEEAEPRQPSSYYGHNSGGRQTSRKAAIAAIAAPRQLRSLEVNKVLKKANALFNPNL
ncbi:hypothetical protein [uncultured Desulfobacter sp.]|uniref:hypothetical protein n=1 Tax=uncultured Desulfobacter sp. TaxID=240139 RepID=UPI00374A578D